MESSILTSTKRVLGLSEDYNVFDDDVLMHINSVFSTLHQLGVGPSTPFTIQDATPTWDDFSSDPRYSAVRSYMYLRVRMLFDPPTTSFLLDAYEKQIKEMEWRLNVLKETEAVYLLSGRKRIVGNLGDEYPIRMTNPSGQTLIEAGASYSAEFVSSDGRTIRSVVLDISQEAVGVLTMQVVIENGVYTVRRLNPSRTILVLEVNVE